MQTQNSPNNYCQEFLSDEFAKRKKKNPSYSIRALARDLDIGKTTVNDVIKGSRRLSQENIVKLQTILKLDNETFKALCQDIAGDNNEERLILSEDDFSIIKDWYYFAIINLAKLPRNKCDAQWIADRLGLSLETSERALNQLLELGILKKKNGKIIRTEKPYTTSSDIPSESIREHHRQSLLKAVDSLHEVDVEFRDFTTVTYAISLDHIEGAKKLITNFHRKLGRFLQTNKATDVYRLNVQFFPLTKINQK